MRILAIVLSLLMLPIAFTGIRKPHLYWTNRCDRCHQLKHNKDLLWEGGEWLCGCE